MPDNKLTRVQNIIDKINYIYPLKIITTPIEMAIRALSSEQTTRNRSIDQEMEKSLQENMEYEGDAVLDVGDAEQIAKEERKELEVELEEVIVEKGKGKEKEAALETEEEREGIDEIVIEMGEVQRDRLQQLNEMLNDKLKVANLEALPTEFAEKLQDTTNRLDKELNDKIVLILKSLPNDEAKAKFIKKINDAFEDRLTSTPYTPVDREGVSTLDRAYTQFTFKTGERLLYAVIAGTVAAMTIPSYFAEADAEGDNAALSTEQIIIETLGAVVAFCAGAITKEADIKSTINGLVSASEALSLGLDEVCRDFICQYNLEQPGPQNDLEQPGSQNDLEQPGPQNDLEQPGSQNDLEQQINNNNNSAMLHVASQNIGRHNNESVTLAGEEEQVESERQSSAPRFE